MPAGHDRARAPGPLMGAFDIFEIVVTGKGAHAAMPYQGNDPMVIAAHIDQRAADHRRRNLDPLDAGVVSVTQVHGGDTWNVIPEEVVLRGTVRSFTPEVQELIERRIRSIVAGHRRDASRCAATVRYERRYPATVNSRGRDRARARRRGRGRRRRRRDRRSDARTWAARTSPSCCRRSPAATSGWARARRRGRRGCTTRATTSTTTSLPIGASYWVTLAEQQLAAA